jgi:hypothetical protein
MPANLDSSIFFMTIWKVGHEKFEIQLILSPTHERIWCVCICIWHSKDKTLRNK